MRRRGVLVDKSGRSYDRAAARRIDDHLWKADLLQAFVAKRGWQELRHGAVVAPGVNIYNWACNLRAKYRHGDVPSVVVEAVEAIPGWTWNPIRDRQVRMIDALRAFVRRRGWRALGRRAIADGLPLREWVDNRRQEYQKGELPAWIATALESVPGWSWDPRTTSHTRKLELLQEHIERHGLVGLHDRTCAPDGTQIGRYAEVARRLHRRGELAQWLVDAFEQIPGWSWQAWARGPASRWDRDKVVRELRRLHAQRVRITPAELRRRGRYDLLMSAHTYVGGLRRARRLASIPDPRRKSRSDAGDDSQPRSASRSKRTPLASRPRARRELARQL